MGSNSNNISNLPEAKRVFSKSLEQSMGLATYQYILDSFNKTDLRKDTNFQIKFNGFFKVRRNQNWRNNYYQIFENQKTLHNVSFKSILFEIYKLNGQIEPSFSSKILSIIDPSKPVWDSYVLKNLKIKTKAKNKQEKLNESVYIYKKLYETILYLQKTEWGKEAIKSFDEFFPNYTHFNEVKKLDYILWKLR